MCLGIFRLRWQGLILIGFPASWPDTVIVPRKSQYERTVSHKRCRNVVITKNRINWRAMESYENDNTLCADVLDLSPRVADDLKYFYGPEYSQFQQYGRVVKSYT
ncbi:hypothetical protein BC835DRAFT_963951 [Cytidiella melzeri]|nr:hypothetical protein BC835DRAFT_963951 [Cytidiella melzeri]